MNTTTARKPVPTLFETGTGWAPGEVTAAGMDARWPGCTAWHAPANYWGPDPADEPKF